MDALVKAILASIARHLLTMLATYFIAAGMWSEADATEYIAGGSLALAAIGWALYQKLQTQKTIDVALRLPEGSTRKDLEWQKQWEK